MFQLGPNLSLPFNKKGFIHQIGGDWNGNLDAFNDYLFWPNEQQYELIIHGWTLSAPTVNQHMTWDGRPILDVIAEILRDNPQVKVAFDS